MPVWLGLLLLALGSVALAGSYTIRHGRRRNMLADSVRESLFRSLYVVPLVFVLVVIGMWLGFTP